MDGEKKMTQEDKARIMRAEAKKPGADGKYEKGGWPARGQGGADRNEYEKAQEEAKKPGADGPARGQAAADRNENGKNAEKEDKKP